MIRVDDFGPARDEDCVDCSEGRCTMNCGDLNRELDEFISKREFTSKCAFQDRYGGWVD